MSPLKNNPNFNASFIPPQNNAPPIPNPKIIQTENSKIVRSYPGDLTEQEKSNMEAVFIDDNTLKIVFKQFPDFNVTIRRQDIFSSGAEVIVNAANSHLGGGGGIDGAIHAKGGKEYAEEHRELQKEYHANYVLGHAAGIGSGLLKEKYNIDNVIVVAGPQGDSNFEKESQLYSCGYNSLDLADSQGRSRYASPSISTGIYGFPRDRAANIRLRGIYDFIVDHSDSPTKNISIHFLPSEPKDFLEDYQKAIMGG
jgi:O-acetyl-ADP-ribose deacetylase (regulator of RNase III)